MLVFLLKSPLVLILELFLFYDFEFEFTNLEFSLSVCVLDLLDGFFLVLDLCLVEINLFIVLELHLRQFRFDF